MKADTEQLIASAESQTAPTSPLAESGVSGLDLAAVWFVCYRLRLIPRSRLVLPAYGRGAVLRGAFGITLRKSVCHDLTLDCRACPIRRQCPYPEVFEPAPPEGGDRLSSFSDIPRPFLFDPPTGSRTEFPAGEAVEFGLTVFGRTARLAPYFVAAFQKLADDGLGLTRATFDLADVAALSCEGGDRTSTPIYTGGQPLIRMSAPPVRAADLIQTGDETRGRLRLRFTTPVDIRDQGVFVRRPELGPLVRRLRDRASSLAAFYGDGPLSLDFRGISSIADTVRLVEDRTRVIAVGRQSGRTGQRHDIGGFVGEATYEGSAIGKLMPLIRLGEVMHVGKHAAFGNGRMEVL
jgi:hypothetical protein